MIPFIFKSRTGKAIGPIEVSGCLELGVVGVVRSRGEGCRVFFKGNENVLELIPVMFAHICGYAKKVNCTFKINRLIYKLYLNKAVKK